MRADSVTYRFENFRLRPADRQLLHGGTDLALRPKAFDTLLCLVRHRGHAVSKAELLDAVWPDVSVSEAVLTHCIAEVRQALSDDRGRPRFIKTLARHGYKFIATVETESEPSAATLPITERMDVERPVTAESASLPPPSAIVVLPFANMSAEAENEYLCDGLSEELINGLTRIGTLQVVAHSSSFSFKGRDIDAREIGRQLNAAMILEGSVRRTGDRLRVSAQLIDAARGYHVWCNQYDRRLEDLFAIQDEISQAILASLNLGCVIDPQEPAGKRRTANMDAYMLYLHGRTCWHQRYGGLLEKAMECFGQAIGKDPGFPLPYAGLADCLSTLGVWGFARPRDVFPKAAALADTARSLDEGLAEAHASRAMINLFWDWDWSGAERGLLRALELNPGNALIRLWYGHYLSMVGRMDEAIAEMTRAQALDPLSPVCSANLGWTLYLAHDQPRAVEELQKVLAREPQNAIALFYLGYAWMELRRDADAIDCLRRAATLAHGMPWVAEGIGLAHGLAGRREHALASLEQAKVRACAAYQPASALALVHLGLGDDEAVLDCLEQAIADRDVLMPWLKFMPPFDRLHAHPRFQAVLRAIGL